MHHDSFRGTFQIVSLRERRPLLEHRRRVREGPRQVNDTVVEVDEEAEDGGGGDDESDGADCVELR